MFLRYFCTACALLLLGGCQGWLAETRLIPVSERDPIGLEGTYLYDEGKVTITPGRDGLVVIADKKGDPPQQDLAFDFLRDEADTLEHAIPAGLAEGEAPPEPDRTYLMEAPIYSEEGVTGYYYRIVRISRSSDGSEASLASFALLCSKSTEAFAAQRDGDLCRFDDYARLRAAAFDALAWYDDARMPVEPTKIDLKRKRERKRSRK